MSTWGSDVGLYLGKALHDHLGDKLGVRELRERRKPDADLSQVQDGSLIRVDIVDRAVAAA